MTLFIDHYHLIRENIMKHTTLAATLIAAGILLTTGSANAALVSVLGGQAINDTDRNIVWAADANLAASNTFGLATGVNLGNDSVGNASIIQANGFMSLGGAQKWISAMNAANYLGYNDWRLPSTTDTGVLGMQTSNNGTDGGYNNPTTSELSHLFYSELGNKGQYNTSGVIQTVYGLNNTGPFTNFQSNWYWSGTEYAPNPNNAWLFNTFYGLQSNGLKSVSHFALAVRSGQIASVPEADTCALLIAGLGLMGFLARRKAA